MEPEIHKTTLRMRLVATSVMKFCLSENIQHQPKKEFSGSPEKQKQTPKIFVIQKLEQELDQQEIVH